MGRVGVAEGLLPNFLESIARRKWRWGETDCLMILADWIKVKRGIDPAATWRGSYRDEAECAALLRREGGIRKHVCRVLATAGIERTVRPKAGDIALIMAPVWDRGAVAYRPSGAICVSASEWAVLTRLHGLVTGGAPTMRPLLSWSV